MYNDSQGSYGARGALEGFEEGGRAKSGMC